MDFKFHCSVLENGHLLSEHRVPLCARIDQARESCKEEDEHPDIQVGG